MKTNKNSTEKLESIAEHLLSDALYNEPYTLDKHQPIIIPFGDGTYEYIEPFFQYVIQELPYIFPEDWIEGKDGTVFWTQNTERDTISSLIGFLEISETAIKHILVPGRQNLERFGGRILNNESTHFEIALNIFELINKLQSKSIAHANPIFYN